MRSVRQQRSPALHGELAEGLADVTDEGVDVARRVELVEQDGEDGEVRRRRRYCGRPYGRASGRSVGVRENEREGERRA